MKTFFALCLLIILIPVSAHAQKDYTVNDVASICDGRSQTATERYAKGLFARFIESRFNVAFAWNRKQSYQDALEYADASCGTSCDPVTYQTYQHYWADEIRSWSTQYTNEYWNSFIKSRREKLNSYKAKQFNQCVDKFLDKFDDGKINITE